MNDLKDIYIIDQSNQVHYIDGNGEKYGNLEVDGLKKIVGSSSDWLVEGNKVVQYLGVLDEETNIVIPNYVGNTKITTVGSEIFKDAQGMEH